MKSQLVAILGLLLACTLAAAEAQAQRGEAESILEPNPQSFGFRGRVRSVRSEEFRITKKNGKLVQGRTSFQITRFDPNGRMTESIEDDGKTTQAYDSRGRLAEMVFSIEEMPFTRIVISYDEEKRTVQALVYFGDNAQPMSREIDFLDDKGNVVRKEEERYLNMSGEPEQSKSVVTYTHTYDAQGREVSSTIGDEKGDISHKFDSEYDAQGHTSRMTSYYYNENDGTLVSKTVDTYDARGEVSVSESFDHRGKFIRREQYSRVYDSHGNWIKETVQWLSNEEGRKKAAFTTMTRRTITYY